MTNATQTVTFTADATYRGVAVVGTFEAVTGFVAWGGTNDGEGKRRVGTAGKGYVKVLRDGRKVKVTVSAKGQGYTVNADASEVDVLQAEVDALAFEAEAATGPARANLRKKLARRVAKLTKLNA